MLYGEGKPQHWCLVAKRQSEAKLCAVLAGFGIPAFYPVRKKTRHINTNAGRKKIEIEQPIISGYVFATIPSPNWYAIRSIPFLVAVFGTDGEPRPIHGDDMDRLRRLRNSEAEIQRAKEQASVISAGDRVEITKGPLTGMVLDVRGTKGNAATLDGATGCIRIGVDAIRKL